MEKKKNLNKNLDYNSYIKKVGLAIWEEKLITQILFSLEFINLPNRKRIWIEYQLVCITSTTLSLH